MSIYLDAAMSKRFLVALILGSYWACPVIAQPKNTAPPFVPPGAIQVLSPDMRPGGLSVVPRAAIKPLTPGVVTGPGLPGVSPFAIQIVSPQFGGAPGAPSLSPSAIRLIPPEDRGGPGLPSVPPGSVQKLPPQGG